MNTDHMRPLCARRVTLYISFFWFISLHFYLNNAMKAPTTIAQRKTPTSRKIVESSKPPPSLTGVRISGLSISHLADENPDQPKSPGEYRHQTITYEFPEAVAPPLYNIDEHITSKKILKEEASFTDFIVLPPIIKDVSTATLGSLCPKKYPRLYGKRCTTTGEDIHYASTTRS